MDDFKLDFIGVGMAKAGTTWVHKCLDQHPQVCLPGNKELNYFCTRHSLEVNVMGIGTYYTSSHRNEGSDWFREQFNEYEPGQIKGEISPTYFFTSDSPELIYEHNPKVKLIFNLRNPSSALYSAYYQINKMLPVHGDFEKLMVKYPNTLNYFKVYTNVKRYLEKFPVEQVHFMLMDDIKNDPETTFDDLCKFLGIDNSVKPEKLSQRVNPRTVIKSKLVRDIIWRSTQLLNTNEKTKKLKPLLKSLGLEKLEKVLRKMNYRRVESTPPMSPETRAKVIELYREEVLQLGDLLGRDLSHWNK